jgi:2-polyprenyl-6-methoxyphenol hydroxylase-like FAD-dependent oxidoreductase
MAVTKSEFVVLQKPLKMRGSTNSCADPKNLPSNLLVPGDALSSFKPIYGQGMTVAAQEALILHGCLKDAERRANDVARLRSRYFRGVSSLVKGAWAMATGADLAYPQAAGQRPFGQAMSFVIWPTSSL